MYAMVAPATATGGRVRSGFYKCTDAGEHWALAMRGPEPGNGGMPTADPRPLVRIGGGDLPTIVVDPKDPNVVYSASTVMWRTEDGGTHLVGGAWRARAATTTSGSGSTRNTPTSFSPSRTRAAWSRPTGAGPGATGTTSPPRRCTTSPPTTISPTGSAAGSRTPARRAWTAARWTARSPSTTGTRSTSRSTASRLRIPGIPTSCSAARGPMSRSTTGRPARPPRSVPTRRRGPRRLRPQRAHHADPLVPD